MACRQLTILAMRKQSLVMGSRICSKVLATGLMQQVLDTIVYLGSHQRIGHPPVLLLVQQPAAAWSSVL